MDQPHVVGRYAIFDEIASGGMATVHVGRLIGPVGFSRTVAIKRLHSQFAKDPEFVSMFVDEARLAARIRHPNVVPTLDVVRTEDELFLVMEYVQGESLSRLLRAARRRGAAILPRLVVPVMAGVLHGLHAAHTAKGERGEPLHIVHRDVSPQNVLVGCDGVPRVFDFGVAKARGRLQTTREGQIKGKLAYMAPEQLAGAEVTAASDVYSAAVVLWEALAGRRLFEADNEGALLAQVLHGAQFPPSAFQSGVPPALDGIVMQALARDPVARPASARAMASMLERVLPCAPTTEIGEWVEDAATDTLHRRAERIAEIESRSGIHAAAVDWVVPSSSGARASLAADGASSQLSSISVAQTVPERRRAVGLPLALGLLVAGGAVAAATLVLRTRVPALPDAPSPAAADPAPAVSAPASGQAAAPASGSAAPPASASATATVSPSVSARPPLPKRPVVRQPAPRPKVVPKPDCDPPYRVDAEGIRHPKPECL